VRRGVAWACAAAAVVAPLLRAAVLSGAPNATAAYVLTPCRMDALAVGGLVACLAREPGGLRGLARLAPAVAALSGAALLAVTWWRGGLFGGDPAVEKLAFTPLALLFGAVLVLAVTARPGSGLARVLGGRALGASGRYAYGLYVLHYPVFRLLEACGLRASAAPPALGSRLPGLVLFAAAAGALSFAAALLSWRVLEAPLLALKARVPYGEVARAPGARQMKARRSRRAWSTAGSDGAISSSRR
jgi:peptidoglycan/LPS O-acetylase OafA/YrhL